jgi:hypothetical protein
MTPELATAVKEREPPDQYAILRAQHDNASSPLCRLPVELLTTIFQIIKRGSIFDVYTGMKVLYPFLSACRYLYYTAVNTPALWTDIQSTSGEEWIDIRLKRRQQLPLDLWFNGGSKEGVHLDFRAHLLMARIAVVHLPSEYLRNSPFITWTLPELEPLIATLETANSVLENLTLYGSSDACFKVTQSFLGGSWTRLTKLHLSASELTCTLSFPVLRFLKLSSCECLWELLYSSLENSASLEVLELERTRLLDKSIHIPKPKVLPLLNLKSVCITQDHVITTLLLFVLPDPKLYIGITLLSPSFDCDFTTPVGKVHQIILDRLRSFWQLRAGAEALPIVALVAKAQSVHESQQWPVQYSYQLQIGWEPFPENVTFPCVWWTVSCTLLKDQPFLDSIRELNLQLWGDRVGLMTRHQEHINLDLLREIDHVVIGQAFKYDTSWREFGERDLNELKTWIMGFVESEVRPLESIRFQGCRPDMEAFAKSLHVEQLVNEIFWQDSCGRTINRFSRGNI